MRGEHCNVVLAFTLRESYRPNAWSATAVVSVEAGEEMSRDSQALWTTYSKAHNCRTARVAAAPALAWRLAVLSSVPPVASRGRSILAAVVLVTALVGCGVLSGRTYQMDTPDMAPTIPRGTELSLQSVTAIHRGDIVAVNPPAFLKLHGVNYLLRRVVGLPGETISARNGHIVINARALAEPYLPRGASTPNLKAVRIPKAHYFVLGDNRRTALDSRRFGPVPRSTIVGRATE
jgi:signal peptidase I